MTATTASHERTPGACTTGPSTGPTSGPTTGPTTGPTSGPTSSMAGRRPLTTDGVASIMAIADPAVRNLWITQSYADLGCRLGIALGSNHSWCTFAVWASNTAGESIRGEELPRIVTDVLRAAGSDVDATVRTVNSGHRHLIRFGLARALSHSRVEHLVAEAVTQVSAHIAHGNTLVYGELAPLFVKFIEGTETGRIDGLVDRLGLPQGGETPLVRTAFEHYSSAVTTNDPSARAQHVLTANIAAVLHEQQRLQSDITAAMNAGLIDLGDEIESVIGGWVPGRIRHLLVRAALKRTAKDVERIWQHIATEMLMRLDLPGQRLHLGRDVPALPDGTMFPAALQDLGLSTLCALMTEWDRTGGTGRPTGAHDWADLHQRMNYIVTLFRSRQHDRALTAEPFTADDLHTMTQDELPTGM